MENIKNKRNKHLEKVYEDTENFFNSFPLDDNIPFIYENFPEGIMISTLNDDGFKKSTLPKNTPVKVKQSDVLNVAKCHLYKKLNPVILNFASKILPGGGVKKGAISQEEDIFRRTNLFQSLNKDFCNYPLSDIVYSPHLYVAKGSDYKYLDEPFSISCISAAALRWPCIMNIDGYERFTNKDDETYVKNAIETIFKVAILHNHTSIILGAWGCGAYEGPRDDIARLFNEAILKYKKYFNRIDFAILVRNKRDRENYEIFKRYFS